LTATEVESSSFQISTTLSNSQSLNTSLREVVISSNNKHVFIRDLNNHSLQIIFDASWASMNLGPQLPITWNNSRQVPLWRFYVQCGIEETSSPGIIYIVCNEVLHHPSDHGTSSMGNYFLRTVYIAKLYKVTQSEVTKLTSSTVDETTLSIMNKKESRGNRIVSLQRRSKLDFQVLFILTKLTEITLQTGSEGL
jgi:hypothetical protein